MHIPSVLKKQFFCLSAVCALTTAFSCQSSNGQQALPVQSAPQTQDDDAISGMVGLGTWKTQAEFKDFKVTRGDQVLYDSNRANGLQGWKPIRGDWKIVNGALRQSSNDEDTRIVLGDPSWNNYTLTFKARKLGGDEGFLVLFGLPDENTRNWWNIGGWGNTKSALDGPGIKAQEVNGSIETGRWYDIKVELSGDTIRTYIDGQLIQTATQPPGVHTVEFDTDAPGEKKFIPQWGLDTSWASPENMWRGLSYMGKDRVDVVRVAFPIDTPLENGELSAAGKEEVDKRARIAMMAGDKPWVMMPHQEGGVHAWYKNGDEVNVDRWVQAIVASQRRYGKKLASIEAFNEPDYGWNQGTVGNLNNILGVLRNNPEFAGVQMSGPSTLNSDAAMRWYEPIKNRVDRGTTHALAGSMDTYINLFQTASADGKVPENPEPHNLSEVIAGAQYGIQRAIWWGTAELARGEFVKASDGVRLAYAEDRPRWSAAAVYRAPDGKLQAFAGSSERQGETTTYRFVSKNRPVFFNGDGPRREFTVPVRRQWDVLVNITWGEDVQPKVGGQYVIVNRQSGKVLSVAGANTEDGAAIGQTTYNRATNQQWEVAPFVAPFDDQSYFTIRALHSGKTLDTADWNNDEGGKIQQWGTGNDKPQHWYFDYAGDNYFYIHSSWSNKVLGVAGNGSTIQQFSKKADDSGQQWRLVPVSALASSPFDFVAPSSPTELKATTNAQGVALSWNASPAPDVASYTVFRSASADGPYDTIARDVIGTSFTDTEGQRKYFYKVKAIDRSLNRSAFSNQASATFGG